MVVTPYVSGLTERVQRVFKKYNVDVVMNMMKPHSTLRNLLVHPKDKREKHQLHLWDRLCKLWQNLSWWNFSLVWFKAD